MAVTNLIQKAKTTRKSVLETLFVRRVRYFTASQMASMDYWRGIRQPKPCPNLMAGQRKRETVKNKPKRRPRIGLPKYLFQCRTKRRDFEPSRGISSWRY